MTPKLFSPHLEHALRYSAIAHRQQSRKATDIPYVTHPVHVAWMLTRAGFEDEDLLAAALLHDVVEDCGVEADALAREFNPRVSKLVQDMSERKLDDQGRPRPWVDRKREHLEHLRNASLEVRALALADKLHNLETIACDLQTDPQTWSRFNAPREQLLGYYTQVVEACSAGSDPRLARLADGCRDVLTRLGSGTGTV